MRFGTYLIIGSLLAGFCYGSLIRDVHARCPKQRIEFDWTMVQLTLVWPGLFVAAVMMPDSLKAQPKPACKEDF